MKTRSLLFVPAHMERFLSSALKYVPDIIIIDFEDALPPAKEHQARVLFQKWAREPGFQKACVFMRITPDMLEDSWLAEEAVPHLEGIVLPKIKSPDEIKRLGDYLGKKAKTVKILALFETLEAFYDLGHFEKCAASLWGIGLGGEDYLGSLRATAHRDALLYPRMQLVAMARRKQLSVFDTVFLNYKDDEQIRREFAYSRSLGFDGKFLIHPRQISWANDAFGLSVDEIRVLKEIIAAFQKNQEEKGSCVLEYHGQIYEKPHVDYFRTLLEDRNN